ncbi:DUF3151 domain-containing protein [Brachybacterium halotolerans subsp. kimchii]|uniref:DUF3151 domain-containing protein n=1 Tax=Brachybacterium TaxID=43668 RepID=UPI001E318DE8|nr:MULTISPECIES: DUF3151 domain-containing protein [Brachybacterium]MCG7311268.1 DUF3151 domain-containing protein [Brachybacterium sp. ACRRE]UEJ82218.1 DUF3151 domain-containing protein [Brachybacterium halotolerans subsp. kimchii]
MNETSRPIGAENLLGIPPTYLPEDHPDTAVAAALADGADARELAARYPASSLAWAELAQEALESEDPVAAYAYARTGYHRGLDALRRAGWKGQGPIPASHAPNRGFLKALALLGESAGRIGERDEAERIRDFVQDADPSLLG